MTVYHICQIKKKKEYDKYKSSALLINVIICPLSIFRGIHEKSICTDIPQFIKSFLNFLSYEKLFNL